uniref:Ribosomal protein L14 n=1 Tax=Babesia rodhaini TaxID=5870 RepID=A0A455R0Z7_BABRO|nr:ribosomal protein L14 [Babesia rodhaini]
MIIIGSIFKTSDNSGVRKILSIGVLNKNCIRLDIGDYIIGSVKKGKITKRRNNFFGYNNRNFTLKSSILKFFIVKSKKFILVNTNNSINFCCNSVITLGKDINLIEGKKVTGIMSFIVKKIFYKSKVNLKNAKFII